jgi:L-ascorbate oxidase
VSLQEGKTLSIFSYEGAPASDPTSIASTYTQSCSDETGLVPHIEKNVPSIDFASTVQQLDVFAALVFNGTPVAPGAIPPAGSVVEWGINTVSIEVDW